MYTHTSTQASKGCELQILAVQAHSKYSRAPWPAVHFYLDSSCSAYVEVQNTAQLHMYSLNRSLGCSANAYTQHNPQIVQKSTALGNCGSYSTVSSVATILPKSGPVCQTIPNTIEQAAPPPKYINQCNDIRPPITGKLPMTKISRIYMYKTITKWAPFISLSLSLYCKVASITMTYRYQCDADGTATKQKAWFSFPGDSMSSNILHYHFDNILRCRKIDIPFHLEFCKAESRLKCRYDIELAFTAYHHRNNNINV